MAAPSDIQRKDARLAVRITPDQDSLIRDAAATTGQSLSEFVTSAAISRAHDVLADRRMFHLVDFAWAEFTAILDRPTSRIEELAELLHTRPRGTSDTATASTHCGDRSH